MNIPTAQIVSQVQTTATLGVLTAHKGSTQKCFYLDKDGKLQKPKNHSLSVSSGTFEDHEVEGLADLAHLIESLTAQQALTLGSTGIVGKQKLVTKERWLKEGKQTGTMARTAECLNWQEEHSKFLLLDHDAEPGKPEINATELWQRLTAIMPELEGAGRLVTPSTSSFIYDSSTGECLRGDTGHHTYIQVLGDVDRFKRLLEERCWQYNEAFFKLATTNKQTGVASVLERFLLDTAVFSPERIIYETGAKLGPGLEQRRPAPQLYPGNVLDLDALPELTPDELATASRHRAAAKAATKGVQFESTVERLIRERKVERPKAQEIAAEAIAACEDGVLSPDHVLHFPGGKTLLAGNLTDEHIGQQLYDPQEPDYNNWHLCAKVFKRYGQFYINSFAHGQRRYAIASTDDQPQPKTKAEQFKEEVDYWQGWVNRLDLEPTLKVTDRYLPAGTLPEPGSIVLVDAPMGTGKTSSYVKGLVDNQEQIAPDGKFIMLGDRNLLQHQTMGDYGGKHHSQYASCTDMWRDRWWVGCYDSIFKFDPTRITEGSIVFLDEISSGGKHLLVGSTLKEMRPFAARRFAEICRVVIQKGGWIVGSVDNLTNVELGLLRDIVGVDVPVSLTQSKWKGDPWEITVFDSATQTLGKLREHFADNPMFEDAESQPARAIEASDSAKFLRETERFLVDEVGLPQERVWILDADSSPEPWAKAFAADPNKWIADNQPLFFGYSPTLQSGVSITAKNEDGSPYFQVMAVHLIGVLEPRDAIQLPARYRLPVPRFGYIKEFATKDDGCRSLHPDVILRDLKRTTQGIALYTQIAEQVAKEQASLTGEDVPDLSGTLTRLLSDDADSEETFWLKHYARIVARENGGRARLQADIIERWEAKGHQVSVQLLGPDKELTECRQRIREQLDGEEATAFACDDISEMTVEAAREILDHFGSTKEDRRRAKKRLLVERLPGCPLDTVEFVHKAIVQDNAKFLRTAELLWAYQHPDWQQQIDRLNLFGKIKRAATRKELVYAPDIRSRGYQADLMSRSPLHDCLNDEWYGDDSPQVVKFKAWALWNRAEIYAVLRLNVQEGQSGTAILGKFLRKLGFELADKRPGKRGEDRPRIYRIKNLEDCDRDAILTALTAKFQASQQSVSNICTIETPLQTLDTEPPEDHSEDDLWTTEAELDNIRAMWEAADSSEARRELLKVIPLTALERAIPSDELRNVAA